MLRTVLYKLELNRSDNIRTAVMKGFGNILLEGCTVVGAVYLVSKLFRNKNIPHNEENT